MTEETPPGSASLARTYIGGVGYTHLRDFSAGPAIAERLEKLAHEEGWPDRIAVGDLSYDPVKIVHWLEAEEPPWERLILISAVQRGRPAGEVTAYRWNQTLPDPEEIQGHVSEAVTGVIHLDNLLVVLTQFGTRPLDIVVVEIEPEVEEMGEALTPAVAHGAERAVEIACSLALDPAATDLPTAPMGGFGSTNGGSG